MSGRNGADRVAAVLASVLIILATLIGVAIIVNVATGHSASPSLGENSTQVLTGLIGGVVGILGAYIGLKHRREEMGIEFPRDEETEAVDPDSEQAEVQENIENPMVVDPEDPHVDPDEEETEDEGVLGDDATE